MSVFGLLDALHPLDDMVELNGLVLMLFAELFVFEELRVLPVSSAAYLTLCRNES